VLIGTAALFLGLFLVVPVAAVFAYALRDGAAAYLRAISDPYTLHAIRLTLLVSLVVVPVNLVFGLAAAWLLGRFRFRGRAALLTLIDVPFSVSPVIAGLVFVLLLGGQSRLGSWLAGHDVHILFAFPGLVLVTLFVTLPFVVREVLPVLQAQGSEEEEVALSLGASGWQMFFRVTLPKVRWGVVYGVVLCNARAMGEFGAVSVVSGHIRGATHTLPLQAEALYYDYNATGAFAVASLLTVVAVATLAVKKYVEWRSKQA
jgi:sulfate transport system permease protein